MTQFETVDVALNLPAGSVAADLGQGLADLCAELWEANDELTAELGQPLELSDQINSLVLQFMWLASLRPEWAQGVLKTMGVTPPPDAWVEYVIGIVEGHE